MNESSNRPPDRPIDCWLRQRADNSTQLVYESMSFAFGLLGGPLPASTSRTSRRGTPVVAGAGSPAVETDVVAMRSPAPPVDDDDENSGDVTGGVSAAGAIAAQDQPHTEGDKVEWAEKGDGVEDELDTECHHSTLVTTPAEGAAVPPRRRPPHGAKGSAAAAPSEYRKPSVRHPGDADAYERSEAPGEYCLCAETETERTSLA